MIARAPVRRKRKPKLTVLSFGGGQDSTAILYRMIFDPEFRQKYAPNDLLVVMADTGNEHPATYLHVIFIKRLCRQHKIEFVHITPDMGFHNDNWKSLTEHFEIYDTVMTKRFVKSCTDNLKIQPIYKFLSKWVALKYGYHQYGIPYRGKHPLVCFAEEHGPISMLIGIAAGEEKRVDDSTFQQPMWMKLSISKVYPLIELGMDRLACQKDIASWGMRVPPPSNCMFCPFMSKLELLWLYYRYPDEFAIWVRFEARKLKKFASKGEANVGVFGTKKTLLDVLAAAKVQYKDWTMERIEEHKFSHGHCVKSRY